MTACRGLSKPRKKKRTKSPMKEGGVPKVRKKKTSGGRDTVTTMNHHISNCDRDYLQSAHTAPHKQQPLLIENTKTDRFTPLTHASLLQHQLPTGANAVLCGSDLLSQTTRTHSSKLWVPKSSPHHVPMNVHKALTNSSYHSPVQVAVRTEKQVDLDQRDLKPYSCPTYNAAANLSQYSIPGFAVSVAIWK